MEFTPQQRLFILIMKFSYDLCNKECLSEIKEGAVDNKPLVGNTLRSFLMLPSKLPREGRYICRGHRRHWDTQSVQ